jgi:hypothetical protein
MRRRELLKAGSMLVAAVPVVLTLEPKEARAEGSWSPPPDEPNTEAAQGLGRSFVLPGTYRWREQRMRAAELQRRELGAFDRFGRAEE